MCFSGTASFTTGTALIAVGAVTVHRSRGKAELPLALVPLLFGGPAGQRGPAVAELQQ